MAKHGRLNMRRICSKSAQLCWVRQWHFNGGAVPSDHYKYMLHGTRAWQEEKKVPNIRSIGFTLKHNYINLYTCYFDVVTACCSNHKQIGSSMKIRIAMLYIYFLYFNKI
jgi:hypothetical protein